MYEKCVNLLQCWFAKAGDYQKHKRLQIKAYMLKIGPRKNFFFINVEKIQSSGILTNAKGKAVLGFYIRFFFLYYSLLGFSFKMIYDSKI